MKPFYSRVIPWERPMTLDYLVVVYTITLLGLET